MAAEGCAGRATVASATWLSRAATASAPPRASTTGSFGMRATPLAVRAPAGRACDHDLHIQLLGAQRIVVVAVAELELSIEHLLAGHDAIAPVLVDEGELRLHPDLVVDRRNAAARRISPLRPQPVDVGV